jgi:hypothetical protein
MKFPKLKLTAVVDDKPVKLAVELPAAVHRDLIAYAEILSRETGQAITDPTKLVAAMLTRFMATDRVCENPPDTSNATSWNWITLVQ